MPSLVNRLEIMGLSYQGSTSTTDFNQEQDSQSVTVLQTSLGAAGTVCLVRCLSHATNFSEGTETL
jgi:hypothetical protein